MTPPCGVCSCQNWLLLVSSGQAKQASVVGEAGNSFKDTNMMKCAGFLYSELPGFLGHATKSQGYVSDMENRLL